jgi:hypothetical protein
MSRFFASLLVALFCTSAVADTTLTYQGRLDQFNDPVNGEVMMTFQLFTDSNAGTPVGPLLTQTVMVDRGLFSADLDFGNQNYQDALWLQIEVEGEALQPRQRIAAAPLAVRSLDSLAFEASLASVLQRLDDLESDNLQLQAQIDVLIANSSAQEEAINGLLGALADANTEINQLQSVTQSQALTINSLNSRMVALEAKTSSITVDGTELRIDGMNLHLRNGSGTTDGAPNGLGNLIIGYNESTPDNLRSGSHNLILGLRNSYTSIAGIVGGYDNLIASPYAAVITGDNNQATGEQSVIISGTGGLADDTTAVVVGGFQNRATGFRSVTISGWQNDARGSYSAILGGDTNVATATESSIGGGNDIATTTNSKFTAEGQIQP